jgi:nicotinate-nucleotide pyrophosphorylase (carboxylating)
MNDLLEIPCYMLNNIVNNAIQEDLGSFGDLTSQSLENNTNEITATITTNQVGVLSGLHCAEMTFNKIDEKINFVPKLNDGDSLEINSVIASITGSALSILSAERTALNFLGHMSGIASQTRNFVNLISNTNAKILSTRKTTPGLRVIEKYAVQCGGGFNHRFGLDYGILIKDNHIKVAKGILNAVRSTEKNIPHLSNIEVEVDTIEQFRECQQLGVKYILLDNMSADQIKKCIKLNKNNSILEASGGINLKNIKDIAETGIEYISIGRLTHSSNSLDVGMHIE